MLPPGDIDYLNPINWDHPLNRGLVSRWVNTPQQRGGLTWFDLAGRHHGTLTSMDPATVWKTPTRRGAWGEMLCGSGYVDIGTDPAGIPRGQSGEQLTVSFWAYPTSFSGLQVLVAYSDNWLIRMEGGGVILRTFGGNSGTTPTQLGFEEWSHVAVVWRVGSNAKIYINGALDLDVSLTDTSNTSGSVSIGGASGSISFVGRLDAVSLQDRALSGEEVSADYDLSRRYYPDLINRIDTASRFFVPSGGTTTMVAEAGIFSLAGQPADLDRDLQMSADPGSFSLSGKAASLTVATVMSADAGSFVLSGQTADLNRDKVLNAGDGTFTLSGNAAELSRTLEMIAGTGSFLVSGKDASLLEKFAMEAEKGGFVLSGKSVTLTEVASGTPKTQFYYLMMRAF